MYLIKILLHRYFTMSGVHWIPVVDAFPKDVLCMFRGRLCTTKANYSVRLLLHYRLMYSSITLEMNSESLYVIQKRFTADSPSPRISIMIDLFCPAIGYGLQPMIPSDLFSLLFI